MLPPGLKVIGTAFLKLGALVTLLVVGLRLSHIDVPFSHLLAAIALGGPTLIALRIAANEFSVRRAARLSGARIIPRVKGRGFGNYRVPLDMVNLARTGYLGDPLRQMFEETESTVVDLNIFWDPLIFTTNPEHIQRILATDFDNYEKGPLFANAVSSVLGTGVFNSDGDMWKFHRSMTRPFFTRDRISHFDLFSRYTDDSIKVMKDRLRAGHAVDMQDLFGRFTIDVASEFLFGAQLNTLSAPLPYPHHSTTQAAKIVSNTSDMQFSHAFRDAQEFVVDRLRYGPMWPFFEMTKDKTADSMKIIDAYLGPVVAAAVEKGKARKGPTSEKLEEDETLIDHLVNQTTDPTILKDETLNIMVAARDTTAATLTIIVYFLSMYPEVMKRLREEVLSSIGPKGNATSESIKELKYMRAVINETLRLYPIVPFNGRQAIKATVWPSPDPSLPPLYIPAGASCNYSVFLMHRRKDLWGPDAEEFDPDRFLDERLKKYLTPRPFIFLPFNAGPRICLGQQFAYNEMSLMLVSLLQTFESFSLDTEAFPPNARPPADFKQAQGRQGIEEFWPKNGLTLYSEGGMWIRAKETN